MRGEQYFLILIGKDGTKYRVFSKPRTLKEIDEHTVKYENKRELIKAILNNTKVIIKESEIIDVKIIMQPNKNKEEYKDEIGPFYKKDTIVTNVDAVMGKFELLAMNKIFVDSFVRNYAKIPNFKNTVSEIRGLIRNNKDYMDELQSLSEKIFSTYKGARGVYYKMKTFSPKRYSSNKVNDGYDTNIKMSEEEKKEYELEYLKEYERELLDIEDFNHHIDISPFDEHKIR